MDFLYSIVQFHYTINHKIKIEERQKLVDEFSKYANKAIHKLSDYYGWNDGSKEKVVLHTLVGGITSELSGKSFTDGAYASGFNEIMINKIKNIAGTIRDKNGNTYINPTKMQNISMVLGFAINSLLEKDNKMGGYVSNLGSKWNGLDHVQQSCYANEPQPTIEQYLANNINRGYKKGILVVIKSAYVMSVINGQIPEVAENDFIYSFNKAAEIVGIDYRYVEDFGITNNLNNFLWAVHNQDLINSRIIGYGSSAFAGALDYKSKTPIGTVISTIPDLVKDGDINKYGYEGAKQRSLIDYAYTGANITIGALSKGAAYAVGTTIGGILSGEGINKVKNFVAPELPKEDSDERNREYEEKVKREGFNGGIKD